MKNVAPDTLPEYFISTDESYSREANGEFLMNFFVIKNSNDFKFLQKIIIEINQKRRYSETKSTNISEEDKAFLIRKITQSSFENYIFIDSKKKYLNIEHAYFMGLKAFLGKVKIIFPHRSRIHFSLDQIGGEKFQHKCLGLIRTRLKENNHKYNANFLASHKQEVLQVSDVLAGEYRKLLTGRGSRFVQFLSKNKNLLNE